MTYFNKRFIDEKTLIQPILFPLFLKELLNFTNLDYIPEKRNKSNKAPDFTPIDPFTHSFIFETKGSDSETEDLVREFYTKSYDYLENQDLEMAIIANMREILVFSKQTRMKVEEYSFNIFRLYEQWKNGIFIESIDSKHLNAFINKFSRKNLTYQQKLERISKAPPHLDSKEKDTRIENDKILRSIKIIINYLKTDITLQGIYKLTQSVKNNQERQDLIVNELNQILKETYGKRKIKNIINFNQLKSLNSNPTYRNVFDLFYYRVAYFTTTKLLLIRAWEDAGFIHSDEITLYNGGLDRWYNNLNKNIFAVLEKSYLIGKEKYEWLFKNDNNYTWYRPNEETLIDILFELAQYDFSDLDRDVLGTIYEQYLDRQDRKNKGQYYTPIDVVKFIWDRLEFNNIDKLFKVEDGKINPQFIYDCATGSGSFLVEAVKRIKDTVHNIDNINDLLQVRDCIIDGIYGSEISIFAYYLAEVNLLLQLTPLIKKILLLDPKQQNILGQFTLGLIHDNSLKFHLKDNPIIKTDSIKEYKSTVSEIEYLITKPESEKAKIYSFIKDMDNFDYCVANPPYIGESSHKELFRNTLNDIPYWKNYFYGKMDYLYWFLILGISKLRTGGKLGFITTSYWLTADGGKKLRNYILSHTLLKEIIVFGQVKLFKDAKGQNSLILILQKESDKIKRENNTFKIIRVINSRSQNISELINHINKYIHNENYEDKIIQIFRSHLKQGELTDSSWFILETQIDEMIISKIAKVGKRLDSLFKIDEGLVTGCNKVDKKLIEKISIKDKEEYQINEGDGVFVLTDDEINELNLSEQETELVKPFYKNSDIHRYWINDKEKQNVLYITKKVKEEEIPNIINHLGGDGERKFKSRLESRRECKEKKIPWYSLHWPREMMTFEKEKIVFPYRSPVSRFAYTEKPFYGASDMYFITKYENNLMPSQMSLKYLLGILNSSLFRFWFRHRTNFKDNKHELFGKRLETFPVFEIDFNKEFHKNSHNRISDLVENILISIKELHSLEKFYYDSLFDYDGYPKKPKLCKINQNAIITSMNKEYIQTIKDSKLLYVNDKIDDFVIININGIFSNLVIREEGLKYHITINGKNKIVSIDGRIEELKLLIEILKERIGEGSKTVINSTFFPKNIEKYIDLKKSIRDKHFRLFKELDDYQKEIDKIILKLYGLKPSQIKFEALFSRRNKFNT